jgi:hypothetical protein
MREAEAQAKREVEAQAKREAEAQSDEQNLVIKTTLLLQELGITH